MINIVTYHDEATDNHSFLDTIENDGDCYTNNKNSVIVVNQQMINDDDDDDDVEKFIDVKLINILPTSTKRPKPLPYKPLKRHNSRSNLKNSCSRPNLINFDNSRTNSINYNNSFFESDFTFNCKSDISDLESLPDLTDDDSTQDISGLKLNNCKKSIYFHDFNQILNPLVTSKPSIFDIPEIVYKIVTFVDEQNNRLPQEYCPRVKNNHYRETLKSSKKPENYPTNITKHNNQEVNFGKSHLFNCLLVNKLFNKVTSEVISKKFYFDDELTFSKYLSSNSSIEFKPKVFILHKLFRTKQSAIEKLINRMNFSNLNWLELYMCPKLLPAAPFLGHKLTKLIITGSKTVDNDFLTMVSIKCPNLLVLDIRACELISDAGIYQIGSKCFHLTNINFGRKSKGHLITDSSISKLIHNNPYLSTVGLAGCHITDKSIWDLAINCSNSLQRLSLNNCPYILDQSIPMILGRSIPTQMYYFPNLSVLELKFNLQITNWRPIIEFKRRQEYRGISILLEVCDTLSTRIRQQELDMDKIISQRIFKDILSWANNDDDGDVPFHQFMKTRNRSQFKHINP